MRKGVRHDPGMFTFLLPEETITVRELKELPRIFQTVVEGTRKTFCGLDLVLQEDGQWLEAGRIDRGDETGEFRKFPPETVLCEVSYEQVELL